MYRQISILVAVTVAFGGTASKRIPAKRQFASADCGGNSDVVFVVDGSDNVGKDNFNKEIDFVKSTVNRWNISPTGMRVGLVTYGDTAKNQFYLNAYSTNSDIQNALGRAAYVGGNANAAEAIKFAYENSLAPLSGSRSTSPHTIVLVTNSASNAKDLTLLESKSAKDNGNIIYTVGIGSGIDASELSQVSSDPDSRYVLKADSFESLGTLADYLARKTCNEIPTDPNFLPKPTSCLNKADLVFMLDSSSSVGPANFQKLEGFLKDFIKTVNVAPDGVHVALSQFSSYPSLDVSLNKYTNRTDLLRALGNIHYLGGGTNTADAIKFLRENIFTNGGREGVPHIGIVITDGKSASTVQTTQEANAAHQSGIGLIAVGVGSAVDQLELNAVATDPDSENVFTSLNYDQLNTLTSQIMAAACKVKPSTLGTAIVGSLPPETCLDSIDNCPRYGLDVCKQYRDWSQTNCRRYCGFCRSLYTTTAAPCVDALTNCNNYGQSVCTDYRPWAQQNCRLYCGFCTIGSAHTGFYGKCYYKGKAYSHGEKWRDGCDYDCTCTDGASGKYQCYNRCPVYYNLPADCTLVKKSGECCLQPVCNFKPFISTHTGSAVGTYNGINVCMYKGKSYYDGQQWEDGCDYTCTCTDAKIGAYTCSDLCGKYSTIPSTCTLMATPGQCCQKPVCEFSQQQGSFTGYGAVSGSGLERKPTDAPPCKDDLDNCASYGRSVCKDYQLWSNTNCRKYCNLCGDGHVIAGANDRCLFEGQLYSQGQAWKVSCDTECVCENAVYGYYRCLSTCPTYNNLPSGCALTTKAGQCCPMVQCSAGMFFSSSANLNTIGNGGLITTGTGIGTGTGTGIGTGTGTGIGTGTGTGSGFGAYVPPTLPSGATAQPGTGGTGFQAPKLAGCLYNGVVYAKNQRWNDDCSKSCECLDDTTGLYSCRARCPTYDDLPEECTMVPDPNDSCCKIPHCTGTSSGYVAIPSFSQAVNSHGAVQPPSTGDLWKGIGGYTIIQYGSSIAPPTGGAAVFGGIGYCMYKGKQHMPGETWEDGCDYNCVCDDARFGHYTCIEKCRKYTNLPKPFCHLIPDPANACCKIPFCNFTAPYQGITGYASLKPSTQAPQTAPPIATPGLPFCLYNGKHYNQGQQWYDGCSFKCKCDDSINNKYTCLTRCPEYQNLAPGCKLVPDPQDPTCCHIPECAPSMIGTPTPGTGLVPQLPTLPPGSHTGGNTPTGTTGVGYCEYNGNKYTQGEKWEDGCDYNCVCEDAKSGNYRCTNKCPRYADLPSGCRLVSDFTNPCCQVPRCDFTGAGGPVSGIGAPTIGGVPTSGTGPTPQPSFCEYKSVKYSQGQEWKDGCEFNCRCDNAPKGIYTCNQRCPQYDKPVGSCKMVTDPKDSCCLIPVCTFNPGTPVPPGIPTSGTGPFPSLSTGETPAPGQSPNPLAGSTPSIVDHGHPTPYPIPTAVPGKITGSVNTPPPTAGPDGKIPTPATIRTCEYKGSQYGQGQKWRDGCKYTCECTNALAGKYECTDLCPRFVQLPSYCILVKDPANPCCEVPECVQVPGTVLPPTPQTGETPLPGQSPSVGTIHTPYPGVTLGPGLGGIPTPGIDVTRAPKDVCIYKGKTYTQGQSWFDGCDYKCACENGAQGVYRCNDRCATYDSLPSQCHLIADPQDPFCCKMPKCDFNPSSINSTGYGLLPTLPPAHVTGGKATPAPTPSPPNYHGPTPYLGYKFPTVPPGYSTPHPGFTPTPYPHYTFFPGYVSTPTPAATPTVVTTPAPDLKNACVYKGKTYKQGQRWQDGCEYDCVCENGMTGVYKCTEKCQRYDPLPPECQMVRDYLNPCCEKPYCDFRPTTTQFPPTTGQSPNPSGTPTPQAPNSKTEFCVYNGVSFKQGATWNDGCSLKCSCEDAKAGYYRCDQRCLKYDNIPSTCTLRTDPQDSCCKTPFCAPVLQSSPSPITGVTPLPGSTPQPGVSPSIAPGHTPFANPNIGATSVPYPVPIAVPGIKTGNGVSPNHNPKDNTTAGCLYKHVLYKQGTKWQDGCEFNCECVDGMTGKYQCLERCLKYNNVPANCMLVPDTKDACCQVPSCLPPLGTPAPTTPNPLIGPAYSSGATPPQAGTPTPGSVTPQPREVCMYKGVAYTQGQQWYDGCDKVCVCEDSKTGFHRCSDRCTQYKNISPTCTMVADPRDPACCQKPNCIPIPGQIGFSTPKPGAKPTVATNIPGFVTGKAPVIASTPTPGPDGKIPTPGTGPTPAPRTGCVYKSTVYVQGQKWQDGCKYNCICDDGMTGKYTCTERCPSYPVVPPQCTLAQDPKDYCCYVSVCDYNKPIATPGPNPFTSPTPVDILTPGFSVPFTPSAFIIPSPSGTYPPGSTPSVASTPGPIITIPPNPLAFCVYKGVAYHQGQAWQDGCSQKCRCEDADNNYYTCFDRCPSYELKPGCTLVTDPSDSCCQMPQCTYIPTPVTGPTPSPGSTGTINPSLGPGQTPAPNPNAKPYPIPTAIPGTINGANQNNHGKDGYCVYKGSMYKTGQNWKDGCDFNCVCVDDTSGKYTCTERCAKFVNIPAYCVLVNDPDDSCCQKPSCSGLPKAPLTPTPGTAQTPGVSNPSGNTPIPGSTPAPIVTPNPIPKDVCVYMGKAYTQGQQWYQGCDKVCVCDDAHTGLYSCNARCPSYNNLAPNCVMVPDPSDPMCCKAPKCGTNSTSGVIGTITGNGLPPTPGPVPSLLPGQSPSPGTLTPRPGSSATPNPPSVCVYKGVSYKEGQKWQDGCDYDCVCEDGTTGKYKCTDRCLRYPNLGVDCVLAYDPLNPCCKKPLCGDEIPTPPPGVSTPTPATVVNPTLIPGQTPTQQFCVYNGVPFRQGQTWKEGCSKVCRCEDAATRQVNCDDRCPSFPTIPVGCSLATDPNDACCHVINCPSNLDKPTGVKGVPGVITGHAVPSNTLPSQYITGTRDVCGYNGKTYKQGEKWDDGCTFSCECIDAKSGLYKCTEKCARFPPLPSHCTMIQDPKKICCKKVFCPKVAPTSGPVVTPAPGVSTPIPGVSPSAGVTLAPSTGPVPTPPDLCVYKGEQYKQGQMWFDGCDAKCQCEDAKNNYYRCDERCATFPSVAAGCTLVPDPKDPTCCKVPSCPITTPAPGLAPTPGFLTMTGNIPGVVKGYAPVPTPKPGQPQLYPGVSPTLNPYVTPGIGGTPSAGTALTPLPKTGCYYKNSVYQKGQKWDDGCKLSCECVDDVTGNYKCTEKCMDFPTVPSQCVLIQDPANPCCKKPYCDFLNPTPFPFGIPTPAGVITPKPNPGINPSATPTSMTGTGGNGASIFGRRGFCVYQGVYYSQGDEWQQGCSKTCRCEDVTTGYYSCRDRCPTYDNVPANCKLVTSPDDSCCLQPDCNVFPVGYASNAPVSGTGGPGPIPGGIYGNMTGTRPPVLVPTVIPGSITGIGGSSTNYGPTYGSFSSGTRSSCVYKGKIFKQGQTWSDGCTYNCECVDGARGQYRCTDRCPKYNNLPPECVLHPDPADNCCEKALCDFTPTLAPGQTTPKPTSTTPPTIGVINGKCIYKDGSLHSQGEMWSDGCNYNCKCDDASKNLYTCNQKCQAYSGIPSYCHLEPDPLDKCCERPVCTGGLNALSGNNKPTESPTLQPSIQNIVPLGTHNIFTGTSNANYNPTTGQSYGGREVCIYKGHTYKQGDSWNDDCKYVCNCQDAKAGIYQCTSKCPKFPPLPSYCKMQDIPGQCCPSLTCNVPGQGIYNPLPQLVPTPGPTPDTLGHFPTPATRPQQVIGPSGGASVFGGTNLAGGGATVPPGEVVSGLRGVCVYKQKMYHQGETWKDGCDYQCECLDARSGYYSCKPLCPSYDNIPDDCYLVQAPSGCCETPMCKKPDGSVINPIKNPGVFPVFGSFNAGFSSFRPGYNIDTGTSFGGTSSACVYKQKIYRQDQTWEDGCDFHCECVNAATRQYRCTPKCPSYTNLPYPCRLEDTQTCCKAVNCNPLDNNSTSTAGGNTNCPDILTNCEAYGKVACTGQYEPWARKNCPKFCGLCPAHSSTGSSNPSCVDKLDNCVDYGTDSCVGAYEPWARVNCMKTCNYCPTSGAGVTSTKPSVIVVGACNDVLPNCADYGESSCKAPYLEWAEKNCAKTCNLCKLTGTGPTGQGFVTGIIVPGSIDYFGHCSGEQDWVILMKGVAGVPGDLYQLWSGTGTANQYNTEAMNLTSTFKGHYKPEIANDWDTCKFDKVKLAVYKSGVEKANIIFDAKGATKTNWMDPNRIISSTYRDIKTQNHGIFSLKGDPSSGREFYASSESNNCDAYGWIMVSTKGSCFYERLAAKPAFYYSPTSTRSHWGFTNPGEGDVIAILGHGGVCGKNTTGCQDSGQCLYKKKSYKTGTSWQDGCTFNCTCVDGSTNFYKCTDLCPTITDLPQNCKLEKRPGECCQTVVCNEVKGLCYYKGKNYNQGETWEDGCDYKCTCQDGSRGFYQCQTKCLQWHLPPVCHLDAPPKGKCCPVPKCPPGYVINYPAGYVQN